MKLTRDATSLRMATALEAHAKAGRVRLPLPLSQLKTLVRGDAPISKAEAPAVRAALVAMRLATYRQSTLLRPGVKRAALVAARTRTLAGHQTLADIKTSTTRLATAAPRKTATKTRSLGR